MMHDGTCHRDNHNSGSVTAETERGEEDSLPEGAVLRTVFSALCNLWRLVYEARWIYYAVEESPPVYLRVTLVEYAYRELIAWVETLTPFLLRREQNPHYVVVFHIWLHTAILDMWQPFVYGKAAAAQEPPPAQAWTAPRTTQLKTFTAQDRTPEAAYTASVSQLKQLVVEYRSRHAASTYSILWHNGLIYLVNAMLRCTDAEWRLYLLLCVYGYERLSRPYRISEVITRGLLTMTMRDTDMSGSEAERIMTQIRDRGLDHLRDDLHHDIRATFMVDLSLALTDPEAAKAERMASGFGDMAAFQDMIDFDVMDAEGPLP
ncbi:putative zinc finger protein [Rosellinia necatrix]|uniref:Putative zinc finger protein n=1 Tax=Rosellinia necatrix TaxID=77044 RepID=A0A1S8A7A9_ROSNE|nr:putative zinc finger protein [Rosellinia necatrix]